MKRIVVLGGYGAFGGRICELLARDTRFKVIVAGRSLSKATAFCHPRRDLDLTPLRVDRDQDLGAILQELRPWLVIDAAGPFQDATYDVAHRCVEAGCNYIDIADGRAFVEGFQSLDEGARAAGLTLISGASSVPALSSAVVEKLAERLDDIGLVESAISTSNRATVGQSVMEAILSYVGRPVGLRHGGRTFYTRGWRAMRRQTFEVSGVRPLKDRWVAICDVPDVALFSDRLRSGPLVVFRAGVELTVQNLILWLLSWLVAWGWISDLQRWAGVFRRLRGLTSWAGGLRSAMRVSVIGFRGRAVVERRWTLVANQGQGPYTPCLAAPLFAQRLADGRLRSGAFPAVGLLPLEAFEPDFRAFGLQTETLEIRAAPPLYRRVMGETFDRLPPAVRQIHELAGAALAHGRGKVTLGANPLARLIARLMGFPPAGADVPVTVQIFERNGRETWLRSFGDSTFSSEFSQSRGLLTERFGLLRFGFELEGGPEGLGMRLRRWWLGPIRMPLALGPKGLVRETELDGEFRFDVPIALPLVGPMISYRGWLKRA